MIYKVEEGVNFHKAVKSLKQILKGEGCLYRQMEFKEIFVTVSINSNIDDIATIYDLKKANKRLAEELKNFI